MDRGIRLVPDNGRFWPGFLRDGSQNMNDFAFCPLAMFEAARIQGPFFWPQSCASEMA